MASFLPTPLLPHGFQPPTSLAWFIAVALNWLPPSPCLNMSARMAFQTCCIVCLFSVQNALVASPLQWPQDLEESHTHLLTDLIVHTTFLGTLHAEAFLGASLLAVPSTCTSPPPNPHSSIPYLCQLFIQTFTLVKLSWCSLLKIVLFSPRFIVLLSNHHHIT